MNLINAIKALVVTAFLALPLTSLAGEPPLKIKVFHGGEDHFGFAINSVIVMGKKDAVLIDAQFTLSNAHRLVAEILETGKRLTTIYITHAHPDHFFALEQLKAAFPDARVVSIPVVAKTIEDEYDFKLNYWGKVLGNNSAKTRVKIESLTEDHLDLEGQELKILGPLQGDEADSSAVWIPSIKTLVAGDAVFSGTHVFLFSTKTLEERKAWLKVLDEFEALKPAVVVSGHTQNDRQLDPSSIQFTKRYIQTFEKQMAVAKNSDDLIARMKKLYPKLGLFICLDMSAKGLKDGWQWDGDWHPEK